jgi:hypothetical protein
VLCLPSKTYVPASHCCMPQKIPEVELKQTFLTSYELYILGLFLLTFVQASVETRFEGGSLRHLSSCNDFMYNVNDNNLHQHIEIIMIQFNMQSLQLSKSFLLLQMSLLMTQSLPLTSLFPPFKFESLFLTNISSYIVCSYLCFLPWNTMASTDFNISALTCHLGRTHRN